jgi:uncharacterized protein YlzI (FlbEa/FlbD family)
MLNIVVILITLHAPNGDKIDINPDAITAMRDRAPQHDLDESLMVKGVECLISMSDGKNIAVAEHCDKVRELIKQATGGDK